jgi:hypothetical protein
MEKEFAEHSGIPEIIEKFRVIFEQSKGNCKQVSSWVWIFGNSKSMLCMCTLWYGTRIVVFLSFCLWVVSCYV